MTKEKLFIKNGNAFDINEDNIMAYVKQILSVLRRYKDKDNNCKTEKIFFDINALQMQNIELDELKDNVLSNFEKMISDNALRDIKEDPYIKKIKLPSLQEADPRVDKKQFKEISKNISSIIKVQN